MGEGGKARREAEKSPLHSEAVMERGFRGEVKVTLSYLSKTGSDYS
jgi:hypothetical protein